MTSGDIIIDTPGMRELGMWDVSEGIEAAFADDRSSHMREKEKIFKNIAKINQSKKSNKLLLE